MDGNSGGKSQGRDKQDCSGTASQIIINIQNKCFINEALMEGIIMFSVKVSFFYKIAFNK